MGETYEDQQNLDKAEASYRSALELMETTWGESLQTARGRYHLGWATYRRSLPAPAPEQKVMLTAAWEQMENALAVQEKLALGGLAVAKSLGITAEFQTRPNEVDPSIRTIGKVHKDASYPSGHTSSAYAAATVLSTLWPSRAHEFGWWARQAGLSRVHAGVHFPSDVQMGAQLGTDDRLHQKPPGLRCCGCCCLLLPLALLRLRRWLRRWRYSSFS